MKSITNQLLSVIPTQLDYFASNYYLSGSTIIVETIPEYLIRIAKPVRKFGQPVTILEPAGQYSINDFINSKSFFTINNYEFINGLDDEDFILVLNSSLTGNDIVALLSSLPFEDKLQSNQITYSDKTIKDVLDELLYVNTGNLLIKVVDGTKKLDIRFSVLSGNTTVYTGNTTISDKIHTLPSGLYDIVIYPVGYDVLNVSVIDNNTDNNLNNVSNLIFGVDIGFIRTEINVNLIPTDIPVLNSVVINGGATESSNSNLLLTLDTSGIVYEYRVS